MKVYFKSSHAPVELPEGANLSLHLTIQNSPVLFGCRTGLCGTCLVEVEVLAGQIAAPAADEREVIELVCPGRADARLACQLPLTGDIRIQPIPH